MMRQFLVRQVLNRQRSFFSKLAELEKTQYYAEAELKNYQEEKLRLLVKHAYDSVPVYKELFDKNKLRPQDIKKIEDIEKLPIIGKEFIRSNHDLLLSRHMRENIYTRRTGGSTGVPLRIVNNREASILERALYYRYFKWMRYNWGDNILLFWGEPVIESFFSKWKSAILRKIFNINFVSTLQVNDPLLLRLTTDLQQSRPKILRGYASALYLLALKTLELGLRIELNAISTTAEKLYKFQRNKIEEAFGENVFDQYGCGEINSIAFECERHKGMHVASEHVVLEIVDDKGQKCNRGNIIVTDLDNYAMPLIRYKNEDVAHWENNKCECKRNLPLLAEIEGRVTEFIQGTNGNKVHGALFTHIFAGLKLAERYSIKEFRIVQEKIDKIKIEFVTEDNLSQKDKDIIEDKINRYLGNTEIEILKVQNIPLTKMGKKIYILSLLNRDKWENN